MTTLKNRFQFPPSCAPAAVSNKLLLVNLISIGSDFDVPIATARCSVNSLHMQESWERPFKHGEQYKK